MSYNKNETLINEHRKRDRVGLNLEIGVLDRVVVVEEVIQVALVGAEAGVRGTLKTPPFRAPESLVEVREGLAGWFWRWIVWGVSVFYAVRRCRLKHRSIHESFAS